MNPIMDWIALFISLITSISLLLQRDWRWGIGLMAVQYVSIFWLVQTHWPISLAAIKLVTGWMVCTILGISKFNQVSIQPTESTWPQGRLFRLFTTGIIVVATILLSWRASDWLKISLPISWGSLLLIGMGLLQLGISTQPLRVIIGLLTIIAGFEIIYAAVESSTLVAALLSFVTLGLAMAGAYFLNTHEADQ